MINKNEYEVKENIIKKEIRRSIKKGAYEKCPACKGRGCLACDGYRKKDGEK